MLLSILVIIGLLFHFHGALVDLDRTDRLDDQVLEAVHRVSKRVAVLQPEELDRRRAELIAVAQLDLPLYFLHLLGRVHRHLQLPPDCVSVLERLGCGRHLRQDGLERLILHPLQPIVLLLAVGGTSRVPQLDPAVPKNRFAGHAQECIKLSAGGDVAALADLGRLLEVACLVKHAIRLVQHFERIAV